MEISRLVDDTTQGTSIELEELFAMEAVECHIGFYTLTVECIFYTLIHHQKQKVYAGVRTKKQLTLCLLLYFTVISRIQSLFIP